MNGIIYLYDDRGVSKKSLDELKSSILTYRPELKKRIKKIKAKGIIAGEWMQNAIAICFPGGGDVGYVKKLNGAGNANIRTFVEEQGGAYLGFCAGAYFGSNFCDFHRGDTRHGYETIAPRELAFYPGVALGPTLAPYEAKSESGARVANLNWLVEGQKRVCDSYFNGGCSFPDAYSAPHTKVLATYNNHDPPACFRQPAIVECQVGNGKAILSGPHPEFRGPDGAVNELFCLLWDRLLPSATQCVDVNNTKATISSLGSSKKRSASEAVEAEEGATKSIRSDPTDINNST